MLKLRDLARAYNDKTRSYAELLPWFQQVTPGLVLNLDGSLLAVFEYAGPDVESSTDEEVNVAIESMEIALRSFDDHNILWSFLDKRRCRYVGDVTGDNPVARYVSSVWNQEVDGGDLAAVRHVLCISYQPFGGNNGFFDEVGSRVVGNQEPFPKAILGVAMERLSFKSHLQRLEGKVRAAVEAFENQLTSFTNTLGVRIGIRRLRDGAMLAELSNRANVASPRRTVQLPESGPCYLNTMLPTDTVTRLPAGTLVFDGSAGKRLVAMHSVKGYAGFAHNAVVEALLKVPADFTLVQMFRFLDKHKAEKFIQDQEGHYRANIKGPLVQIVEKLTGLESERVNLGMAALAEDAQAALIESTAEDVGYGYHTMAVQVLSGSQQELDRASQSIVGVLANAGYGLVRENVNLVSAFATTIPGAADAVLRSTMLSTRNLSDLTVLRTLSAGPASNRFLTEQRGVPTGPLAVLRTHSDVPENFHLHVGDVGHFMVVGPAGSGKTTFINFLLTCWQSYSPCRAFVLDKDQSNYITITSLGGQYVDLRPGRETARMSPARWCNRPQDYPKLRRWLEIAMCAFDSRELSVREIQVIDKAIEMLAHQHGERSLSALHALINAQDQALGDRLLPWTAGQRYGQMFDNVEDTFALSDICGIEVGGLLADEHLAPAVLGYLFETIEEMVDSTIPTFIYLEEGWYLLQNDTFRARFEDWIKTMRKRTALVGIATQSVADIRRTPISSTLNDNIKTRIFLPNVQAFDSADIYRGMFGLRDDEIEVIRGARQKSDYFIVQENRRRLLNVTLPPEILALTRSDARAKAIFERQRNEGGDDWLGRYVMEINNG